MVTPFTSSRPSRTTIVCATLCRCQAADVPSGILDDVELHAGFWILVEQPQADRSVVRREGALRQRQANEVAHHHRLDVVHEAFNPRGRSAAGRRG